jgi:hypothetical protein
VNILYNYKNIVNFLGTQITGEWNTLMYNCVWAIYYPSIVESMFNQKSIKWSQVFIVKILPLFMESSV